MPTKDLVYFVSGMWCTTCASSVAQSVSKLSGVASAQVNYATKLLLVKPQSIEDYDIIDETIQQKVSQIGFGIKRQPKDWLLHFSQDLENESNKKISWTQVSIVWFLAMWSTMLAVSSYLGDLSITEMYYLTLASAAFGLPAILIGVVPYASSGLRALRHSSQLTLDLFIFLGALAAFLVTLYSLLIGNFQSYADSSSMILAILLLTKKIESSAVENVTSKVLFQLNPKNDQVYLFKNEKWVSATASQIKRNDLIKVIENETIPIDGELVSDNAFINNHLMNGENSNLLLKKGDDVFAGAIAQTTMLIRARAPQGQRKIDQWAENALVSESGKSGFQLLFSKIEERLVIFAFLGAITIASVRAFSNGTASEVVQSFFVGILIFCPCLFASILPLTKQFANLALIKTGVLSNRVDALIELSNIRNFYFDKTGTLEAVDSFFLPYENGEVVIPYLNEIAVKSQHEIFRSLERTKEINVIETIEEFAGEGLMATAMDGAKLIIGRSSFISRMGVNTKKNLDANSTYVSMNGLVLGEIVRKQLYNENSKKVLLQVLKLFPSIKIKILSGDPNLNSGDIYTKLNPRIEYYGNLTPDEKLKFVESSSAYIGDGLNDTLASSRANVSFRIGHRIMSLSPVDFQLLTTNLNLVLKVILYSIKYKKVLFQTAMLATLYNIIAITLAIKGVFSPLGAVVAMSVSFSIMFLSALRLLDVGDIK